MGSFGLDRLSNTGHFIISMAWRCEIYGARGGWVIEREGEAAAREEKRGKRRNGRKGGGEEEEDGLTQR
jgi:hypothetical protein